MTGSANDRDGRVAVGRINGTWGLRGHVKVTPLTSNPERLQPGAVVLVAGVPRRILDVVRPKGFPCVQFEGYGERDAAEALRGTLIEVDAQDLPPLPEHEYYVDDLVGLTVMTVEGAEVGELVEVLTTGANDVYVVRRPGERDVLVPAVEDVVREVDVEGGGMVIEALPGLLDA